MLPIGMDTPMRARCGGPAPAAVFAFALMLAWIAVAAGSPSAHAQAQGQPAGVKLVETFGDWQVLTFAERGATACFAHSGMKSSKGAEGRKRGTVAMQIAHRPEEKVYDEVSVQVGYAVGQEVPPELSIGKTAWKLFADRETVWSRTPQDDAAIVEALKKGGTVTLVAQSTRGTKTTDSFSLAGFKQAYAKLEELCKRK